MKFTGIIAASMLAAGAYAQTAFDLSNLNGTWNLAGLESTMYVKIQTLAQLYNMTVKCPKIDVTGYSDNTVYIQPSVQFGWFNATSQSAQTAELSLSGLLTLDSAASTADEGHFSVQFSVPSIAKGLVANHVRMLESPLSGGSASEPFPHGPDYQGNITLKMTSGGNGAVNDIALGSAANITAAQTTSNDGASNFVRRDDAAAPASSSYQILLVKGNNTLDDASFQNITTTLDAKTPLTHLNNTCSA